MVALPMRIAHPNQIQILEMLLDQARAGTLDGLLVFSMSRAASSSQMGVFGCYSERLQRACYALTKGLNVIADRIAASGTDGHTYSDPIREEQ